MISIHIAFALVSLFYSTYVAIAPSPKKLKFVYLLMLGTFASGILLSLEREISLTRVCISGLAYTGFVLASILLAKRKIASMRLNSK